MDKFQKLNVLPEDLAREVQKMLREYRVTNGFRHISSAKAPDKPIVFSEPMTQTVVLLEDLRGTAFISRAEKLKVDVSSYTLDVVVIGYTESTRVDFPLIVNGVVKLIRLDATAEEFKAQSGVSGEVTLGAVVVSSGNSQTRLTPSRWRISWPAVQPLQTAPRTADTIVPGEGGTNWFTRVEQTLTVGTQQEVEVIQTIPTGWDTPLRAGAVCEVMKADGKYWKVIGAEARLWSSVGNSGVQP